MNPSPEVEFRAQSAAVISTTVVLNIIWWMVMIAAICVGATHLGSCPVQPQIPIYLTVMGGASILSLCLTYTTRTWDDGCACILSSACAGLLHLFTFCWLIAGTVWVYPEYPPNYVSGERYCQKTTYLFAFVITTLIWATMVLIFSCTCCCAILACCGTISAGRRWIPTRHSFYGSLRAESPAGDV